MNKKIALFVVIAILCSGIGFYFGMARLKPAAPADTAVGALMQLSLPNTEGKSQALKQWQGKTLLVNFWATWCPPCVSEMPELQQLQQEYADKNLQIIGIAIDSPSNVREFASQHKISFPLLLAGMEGAELSKSFGNETGGLPFSLLIRPDGTVKQSYLGRLEMPKLRADLDSN
jgi:thiol-disulfide isomerase/thioredoxin